MAHEVFAGSLVQLTAQPISHTLEGRGVFPMVDGGNNEVQGAAGSPAVAVAEKPIAPDPFLKIAEATGRFYRGVIDLPFRSLSQDERKAKIAGVLAGLPSDPGEPHQLRPLYQKAVTKVEEAIEVNKAALDQHREGNEARYLLSSMLQASGRENAASEVNALLPHVTYAEPMPGVPIVLLDKEGMRLLAEAGVSAKDTTGFFYRFKKGEERTQFIVATASAEAIKQASKDTVQIDQTVRHEAQHFLWYLLEDAGFARAPDATDPKAREAFSFFRQEAGAQIVSENASNERGIVYSDDPSLQSRAIKASKLLRSCMGSEQGQKLDTYTFLYPVLSARNFDELEQNLKTLMPEAVVTRPASVHRKTTGQEAPVKAWPIPIEVLKDALPGATEALTAAIPGFAEMTLEDKLLHYRRLVEKRQQTFEDLPEIPEEIAKFFATRSPDDFEALFGPPPADPELQTLYYELGLALTNVDLEEFAEAPALFNEILWQPALDLRNAWQARADNHLHPEHARAKEIVRSVHGYFDDQKVYHKGYLDYLDDMEMLAFRERIKVTREGTTTPPSDPDPTKASEYRVLLFGDQMGAIMSRPDVLEALQETNTGNMDFSESGPLRHLVKFINRMEISATLGDDFGQYVLQILDSPTGTDALSGERAEKLHNSNSDRSRDRSWISEDARRYLTEVLYEKFMTPNDTSYVNPWVDGGSSDLYIQSNWAKLKDLVRKRFPKETSDFIPYINEVVNSRRQTHEIMYNASLGNQITRYVAESMKAEGLESMQNRVNGVDQVFHMFEEELLRQLVLKGVFFNPGDLMEIKDRVKPQIETRLEAGLLRARNGRKLTVMETRRAIREAEAIMYANQRLAVYSGYGEVPENFAGKFGAMVEEFQTPGIHPYKTNAVRWFIKPYHKFVRRKMFENYVKTGEYRNKHDMGGDYKPFEEGMLGLPAQTQYETGNSAYDAMSHGWRSDKMFYGGVWVQVIDADGNPQQRNMLELITLADALIARYPKIATEHLSYTEKIARLVAAPDAPGQQARELAGFTEGILGQRVNLTYFVRDDFRLSAQKGKPSIIRELLWRKNAVLMPSTIANYRPDIIKNLSDDHRKIWEKMRTKLAVVEQARVDEDLKKMRDYRTVLVKIREGVALTALSHQDQAVVVNYEAEMAAEVRRSNPTTGYKAAYIAGGILDYWNELLNDPGALPDAMKDPANPNNLNLSGDEERVLTMVVRAGIGEDHTLASSAIPFKLGLVDVDVNWKETGYGQGGLGHADLYRLFSGDQPKIKEGYDALAKFIEHPTHNGAEAIRKFVEDAKDYLGRDDAQRVVESLVVTLMGDLYPENVKARWLAGKFIKESFSMNLATSKIQEFFPDAFELSYGEEKRYNWILTQAQHGAISSHRGHQEKPMWKILRDFPLHPGDSLKELKAGKYKIPPSPMEMIMMMTQSDARSKRRRTLRILLQFFGLAALGPFMKLLLPGELNK